MTAVEEVLWKTYAATCERQIHAHAVVMASLGKADAERAARSLGQLARYSLEAWKRETASKKEAEVKEPAHECR